MAAFLGRVAARLPVTLDSEAGTFRLKPATSAGYSDEEVKIIKGQYLKPLVGLESKS
jgi:hypothetical protein